mmetsp:Transcript_3796/g.11283  ORF Transcript_3796/g.11283 Transcript_3796/m.11283 type:complete len:221 (-) Transcript_3796:118-780(-)
MDKSTNRNHRQAAVLHLGGLVVVESLALAKVEWVKAVVSWLPVVTVVNSVEANGLQGSNSQDDLQESQFRYSAERRQGAGVGELRGRQMVKLGEDPAEGSQHADSSMLQLRLTKELQVEGAREPKRVKVSISRSFRIELRRALQERNRLGRRHPHGSGHSRTPLRNSRSAEARVSRHRNSRHEGHFSPNFFPQSLWCYTFTDNRTPSPTDKDAPSASVVP